MCVPLSEWKMEKEGRRRIIWLQSAINQGLAGKRERARKGKNERSLGEWGNFGSCAEASGKIIAAYGSPAGP